MRILVIGYPIWEKVLVDRLVDSGFNAVNLKSLNRFHPILKSCKLDTFFRFFTSNWLFSEYVIFIGSKSIPYIKLAKFFRKKIICYWVGSDVLNLKNLDKRSLNLIKHCTKHFSIAEHIKNELLEFEIESEILAITSQQVIPKEIPPMPEEPAVLTYWSKERRDFYGGEIVDKLASEYSNIKFYVLGSNGEGESQLPNLIYLNRVEDIESVFEKTSILLRLTKHDGLPSMVLEMLARGRWVVFSHRFPATEYALDFDECKIILDKLLSKNELNYDGINHVKIFYNETIIDNKLKNNFRNVIKNS